MAVRPFEKIGHDISTLERRNSNGGVDYAPLLGEKEKRLIRDLYAADFERFGYQP